MTQNNLGNMYSDLNAYDRAEVAYLEALEIYQRLTWTIPSAMSRMWLLPRTTWA
ncbi:MAG: tetratricopeptide repeat protein [Lewinellaceae bacterium]|nr:tetratricopeptide repeat protein [Lewinellaceae bacterium]